MIEPMFARLMGCIVFGVMLAAMVLAVSDTGGSNRRDVVAAAELTNRVTSSLFTRP